MAKAKRVFEVAKELGVASKAIVEKCQAEEVPGITNHMSTVKLGLVETIKEWFSETEVESHAVEKAEKVDLTKARKAVRRKAAKKKKVGDADTSVAVATEAPPKAEEVSESRVTRRGAAKKKRVAKPVEEIVDLPTKASAEAEESTTASRVKRRAKAKARPVVEEPQVEPETPVEPAVAEAAPTEIAAEAPEPVVVETPEKATGPMGVVNVPTRPDVVKPAGEKLEKPEGVQLKGPEVIRVEQPDQIRAPRPRRQPGGAGGGGGPQSGGPSIPDGQVEGIVRSRGPARGKGAGGGGGERGGEGDKAAAARKRRSTNTRRGRSADALPTGPTKFSEADLAELDARLKGAAGYVKQRRRAATKRGGAGSAATPVQTGGKVEIREPITIKALSAATGMKSADVIKYLFSQGIMATVNSAIDSEAAMEIAMEYNIELVVQEQQTAAQVLETEFEEREETNLQPRPPVVTVLGHVDHGKTSLLDRIRSADVAAHEDGGITQHVGAYRVTIQGQDGSDKTVVFLDTPGHEAFTSMRSRGASMTDMVVLVVAADDGVMPQTIESINHAKAAGVPLIVALNKVDKQEATEDNIRKIYGQLAEHGLNPVEWGGDTEVVKTSAELNQGITDLMEVLDYQAELLELKADASGPARGTIIETEMQEGRGPVARMLVQEGELKVGDFIVIGRGFGRVRDMTDDRGNSLRVAGPSTPLELSGIDKVPDAGDKFFITTTLQKAEDVAKHYRETERQLQLASKTKVTLDTLGDQIAAGNIQELRVVLKADVQGSIDVLRKSLNELGNDEVAVKVIHSAVGGINESDVLLADASDAVIIGFHVVAPAPVRDIAEQRKVDVRLYRVIYDVTDEVKKALEGMLAPESKEDILGQAEVREVFKISKLGNIAGCLVMEGSIQKTAKARVTRDDVVVTDERKIESLKRVKDDASEVRAGTECGIRLVGFEDLKSGDRIICYNTTEVKRTLD